MTARLELALRALREMAGPERAGALERVEVRPDGTLFLSGRGERGELAWYRFADNELVELNPWRDHKLPITRELEQSGTELWSLLTWRPQRRIVVQNLTTMESSPILKGYRRLRSARAAARHRAAYRAARRTELIVPPLESHDSELDLLTFARLEGQSLDLSEKGVDNAFRIGVGLSQFQAGDHGESLDIHTVRDELAVVEKWFELRELASGPASPEERDLLFELHRIAAQLPGVEPQLCHRDLHDEQFIVTPHGIALLDFDLLCLADPVLDVSNLIAHFSLRALQGLHGATRTSSRLLGDALIEGFDSADESFWLRTRFYQAATFLRLTQLYALRPKWQSIVPDLFQLAEKCTRETQTI